MKVLIRPWPECLEDFKSFNIKLEEYVDLTNEQMERLADKFDIMIRNHYLPTSANLNPTIDTTLDRVMYLSPSGRGFGQR